MNQTSNNNEETENQKENAISKNHNYAKILLGYKKGRTNAWWENVITIKVPKSEWKDNFRMLRKSFYDVETISREETYPSLDSNICRGASRLILYYISNEGPYRKTANAFGISRASISGIIRRVFYAVTTSVDPKLIRLPNTEGEVQELTDGYLAANRFPQCIGVIDGTHIEVAEPSEYYSDFIHGKGYFSLNV